GHGEVVHRVASPAEAAAGDGLFVWLAGDDLFVASPSAAGLKEIESALASNGSAFVGSPFHARLAEVYRGGAGWLLGVDAARVMATMGKSERATSTFDRLGLADAQQFIVESETDNGT